GVNESTRQRRWAPVPVAFMSTPAAIGPTCAPLLGSSTTSKSTSLRYAAQTQAIWTCWRAAGYGYTGRFPAAQPFRVEPRLIAGVTTSYATAGSCRATAWSTKTWSTASTRRRSAAVNGARGGTRTSVGGPPWNRCGTCCAVFGYVTPTPTAVPTSASATPT